jgi:hypothetical protein
MERFYFYIKENGRLVPDDEGLELVNRDAALEEATQAARDLLAECIRAGRPSDVESILVVDESGHPIFVVSLAGLIPGGTAEPGPAPQ